VASTYLTSARCSPRPQTTFEPTTHPPSHTQMHVLRTQFKISDIMTTFPGFLSARRILPAQWDDNLFTFIIRFESHETLCAWIHSEIRLEMLSEVQPMLEEPDAITARQNRMLPDAFSDLMVAQGEGVCVRPPLKWKVAVIITISLFFTVWPLAWYLPRKFAQWGVADARAAVLLSTGFSVFLNSYLTAPLFHNFFGYVKSFGTNLSA
jgi:antibiotic biosynthesis monooxygenase (ABM) superfamily enzyme